MAKCRYKKASEVEVNLGALSNNKNCFKEQERSAKLEGAANTKFALFKQFKHRLG